MNDDHTYDGSNYADAECYMEDAHSLDFDGDRPRALIAMAFAQVKATLAVADALADLKPELATHPWSNPLTVAHPWPPWPSTLPDVDAADRYAANEAKQRDAEPDPLDEDDHRDRVDRSGDLVRRKPNGHWAWVAPGFNAVDDWTLSSLNAFHGPLTFAPEPPPDGARDDLSASEGENGSVEGSATDNAQKAILCPECDHRVNAHDMEGCIFVLCGCPRTPEDVARALIEQAGDGRD